MTLSVLRLTFTNGNDIINLRLAFTKGNDIISLRLTFTKGNDIISLRLSAASLYLTHAAYFKVWIYLRSSMTDPLYGRKRHLKLCSPNMKIISINISKIPHKIRWILRISKKKSNKVTGLICFQCYQKDRIVF